MTPVMLDVTNPAEVRQAASDVRALDLLINNAGVALFDDLSDSAFLDKHLQVNFLGP